MSFGTQIPTLFSVQKHWVYLSLDLIYDPGAPVISVNFIYFHDRTIFWLQNLESEGAKKSKY